MDLPTPEEILSLRNRGFWKWVLLFAGILFAFIAWEGIESSQGSQTFRERKKSADSKVRILREIGESFSSPDLKRDLDKIENYSAELASASKVGTAKEKADALAVLERTLPESLKRWSECAESSADKLLQHVAKESRFQKMETEERHPISAKEEEKANDYFRMAREEWLAGNKFRRDGNHLYALVLYKRSLKYSLFSLKVSKLSYPEEYGPAAEKLVRR
ncbi:PROCN domain protein [Leptospira wolffii]|uniref:PROCN domain protein n=1 Tax=Leptospira wolffii TaxID=409998 RepID=UPI00108344D3|nr:PROCN domain protein [Leptospira wolffii]TGK56199.1 PROCN domain protein [Leptospira wolffii]TGK72246.1 PROCN domain protein [Leptospira wolffii]TGK72848.1 PROCN domain protein [Leptospira wolffii]TGL27823.1 PROCN domain protein [Leptospira wolffii]